MSMAANTCTKSLTGALTLASAGTKDGVPCYKNVSGKWMEVVDPNTNPAAKSSWDMSAPFGFSVPGSTNSTQNSAAAPPTTQTFDPVAEFKSLWAGKPGSTGPAVIPDTTTSKKSQAETILNSGGLLILISVVLVLLSVVTFVSTGSFLATLVVIAILIGVILLLGKLGILKIYFDDSWMLHIEYHDMDADSTTDNSDMSDQASKSSPAPSKSDQTASAPKPVGQSEVFHIGGNDYTYEDAPAVCAAYDSELATYDQLNTALTLGAEWCAYGWSQGGMALYPTQQSTWTQLQADPNKSTACGRPGINGGYFDPATKFGVNCYGPKPSDNTNARYPLPLPGSDPSAFNQMVNKFRSQMNTMKVNAFNRSAWSGWNLSAHQ
jgi:hypothetical protein